jgi:hypothetical protein
MKETFLLTAMRSAAKRIPLGLGLALAAAILHLNATAQDVNLGTANSFAVLANSTITFDGSGNTVSGDVGLYSGTSITGLASVTLAGTVHQTDAVAMNAQSDLTTAYNHALGLSSTDLSSYLNGAYELGNLTLTPGVYSFDSQVVLTGTLTLNNEGNPDAVFVFKVGTALTTDSGSSVVEEENGLGDIPPNPGISVFWQVGSSATLGGSDFVGNVLANQSITVGTGVTVDGRVLAENAAVTLDGSDTIIAPPAEPQVSEVPDTGSTLLLLGSGLAALSAFGRRFSVLLR